MSGGGPERMRPVRVHKLLALAIAFSAVEITVGRIELKGRERSCAAA